MSRAARKTGWPRLRQRCRSHLRSRQPTDDAVCCRQERRATSGPRQALHRVRSRLIQSRTALVNEIRGLWSEFGLIMPVKGVPACRRLIAELLEDGENGLPGLMRRMLFQLSDELTQRDHEIVDLDEAIKQQCKTDERIKRLL